MAFTAVRRTARAVLNRLPSVVGLRTAQRAAGQLNGVWRAIADPTPGAISRQADGGDAVGVLGADLPLGALAGGIGGVNPDGGRKDAERASGEGSQRPAAGLTGPSTRAMSSSVEPPKSSLPPSIGA